MKGWRGTRSQDVTRLQLHPRSRQLTEWGRDGPQDGHAKSSSSVDYLECGPPRKRESAMTYNAIINKISQRVQFRLLIRPFLTPSLLPEKTVSFAYLCLAFDVGAFASDASHLYHAYIAMAAAQHASCSLDTPLSGAAGHERLWSLSLRLPILVSSRHIRIVNVSSRQYP